MKTVLFITDCVLFYHAFQVKSTHIYFDTYFSCISNCWARSRGLQKIVCFNWGSTCRKVWEPLLWAVSYSPCLQSKGSVQFDFL